MREYKKPVMQVERYSVSNSVAWGCSEETKTVMKPQQVNCIINGSEYIIDKDQTGSKCENDADEGTLGWVESKGSYYFVWYNGSHSGQPTAAQTAELTAIEQALNVQNAINQPGWHAGPVTATQYKEMNSTS